MVNNQCHTIKGDSVALIIKRIHKMFYLFIVFVCLILLRVFYLQIIDGTALAVEGLVSRINEVPIDVARGDILDCHGIPMTNNAKHFSIVIFPRQILDVNQTILNLSEVMGHNVSIKIYEAYKNKVPVKIESNVDAATAQKINATGLSGIVAVEEKMRYGSSSLAAHIIGYINSADNKGVSGIEKMYDDVLRGNHPEYLAAMIDAGQQIIPGLGYKRLNLAEGNDPKNIVLTIDSRIQKVVEDNMDKYIEKGAVVVMKPHTGEIVAMASRPNFDANNLNQYLKQNSAPLLNRAITAYQPGSVFKLAVASVAIESGLVKPNDIFFDPGYIDVNNLRFKGWDYDIGSHGKLTFTEALAYSSNPIFIETGLKIGADQLVSYAKKFGFGSHTTLDFANEEDGNLPSPDNLYPGELANFSIGQGVFEATPLQVAVLVSMIVNDGIKVDPYIVSKMTNHDGTIVKNYQMSTGTRILSHKTAEQMKEMMKAVTTYGTGQAAYVEDGGSAGKTGSAETGRKNVEGKGVSHAWFAGYAPLAEPKYVVVVFVENGMSGGDMAAPIFRDIMSQILPI